MKLKTILAVALALLLTACETEAVSFEEYISKADICKNKMNGELYVRYYNDRSNHQVPVAIYCIVDGHRFEITK